MAREREKTFYVVTVGEVYVANYSTDTKYLAVPDIVLECNFTQKLEQAKKFEDYVEAKAAAHMFGNAAEILALEWKVRQL